MRIIVTGGAGFIGRELIRKLNKLKYTDITVIDEKQAYYERLVLEGLAFKDFIDYRMIIEKSDFSFVKNGLILGGYRWPLNNKTKIQFK